MEPGVVLENLLSTGPVHTQVGGSCCTKQKHQDWDTQLTKPSQGPWKNPLQRAPHRNAKARSNIFGTQLTHHKRTCKDPWGSCLNFLKRRRGCKMTQSLKTPAAKPDYLSSIPRTLMEEGEINSYKLPSDLCTGAMVHLLLIHTHSHKYINK